MAKFNITVDLDWLDNEESIDDAIRDEVVNGAREYLLNKANMEIQKKLDDEIGKKLVRVQETVDKTIDEYIQAITTDNISKLKIAEKKSSWSDEVVMTPISEYIGKKFAESLQSYTPLLLLNSPSICSF
jgi:ATP-dependent Lon protease